MGLKVPCSTNELPARVSQCRAGGARRPRAEEASVELRGLAARRVRDAAADAEREVDVHHRVADAERVDRGREDGLRFPLPELVVSVVTSALANGVEQEASAAFER
jgi:hypothetical protein